MPPHRNSGLIERRTTYSSGSSPDQAKAVRTSDREAAAHSPSEIPASPRRSALAVRSSVDKLTPPFRTTRTVLCFGRAIRPACMRFRNDTQTQRGPGLAYAFRRLRLDFYRDSAAFIQTNLFNRLQKYSYTKPNKALTFVTVTLTIGAYNIR